MRGGGASERDKVCVHLGDVVTQPSREVNAIIDELKEDERVKMCC